MEREPKLKLSCETIRNLTGFSGRELTPDALKIVGGESFQELKPPMPNTPLGCFQPGPGPQDPGENRPPLFQTKYICLWGTIVCFYAPPGS